MNQSIIFPTNQRPTPKLTFGVQQNNRELRSQSTQTFDRRNATVQNFNLGIQKSPSLQQQFGHVQGQNSAVNNQKYSKTATNFYKRDQTQLVKKPMIKFTFGDRQQRHNEIIYNKSNNFGYPSYHQVHAQREHQNIPTISQEQDILLKDQKEDIGDR